MSDEHKKRIQDVMNRVHTKELKEIAKLQGKHKRTGRNKKPEKEVEMACLTWLRANGFSVQIYESKAVQINGVWRQPGLNAGNADCQGSDPNGIMCVIEFKAKGKLSTYNAPKNQRQRDYILDKINHGAFACVVDSVELLIKTYSEWEAERARGMDESKDYLKRMLP